MAELRDLACSARNSNYSRAENPVEAAKLVVCVAALLGEMMNRYGLDGLALRAMPQFVRWKSRYSWAGSGYSVVSKQEIALADILAHLLPAPDL